jgi:hypothetical protein
MQLSMMPTAKRHGVVTAAENRRNEVFREIERRRAFARSLRYAIQKAEDADFEIIESKSNARIVKANGKSHDDGATTQS